MSFIDQGIIQTLIQITHIDQDTYNYMSYIDQGIIQTLINITHIDQDKIIHFDQDMTIDIDLARYT